VLAVKPANENEYRLWPAEVSGQPKLQVSVSVARDLGARVLEGVNAVPRRGLEIGGFLVGTADGETILVDGIAPLHSDYPVGPVFRVTPEDFASGAEEAGNAGQIVGVYRSRTDAVLELDAESQDLLAGSVGPRLSCFW